MEIKRKGLCSNMSEQFQGENHAQGSDALNLGEYVTHKE